MRKNLILTYLLCLLIGFSCGIYFTNSQRPVVDNNNKLNEILGIIEEQYVDSISLDSLIEKSIPKMLTELDPHSIYIPAAEVEATNSDLESSFSGIGIRFTIQEDTIHVSDVIRGGPAEQVGMLAGDLIITVNDTLFVGT